MRQNVLLNVKRKLLRTEIDGNLSEYHSIAFTYAANTPGFAVTRERGTVSASSRPFSTVSGMLKRRRKTIIQEDTIHASAGVPTAVSPPLLDRRVLMTRRSQQKFSTRRVGPFWPKHWRRRRRAASLKSRRMRSWTLRAGRCCRKGRPRRIRSRRKILPRSVRKSPCFQCFRLQSVEVHHGPIRSSLGRRRRRIHRHFSYRRFCRVSAHELYWTLIYT